MVCDGFMPKWRICARNLPDPTTECDDVFEPGEMGTDPDLGIDKDGFSFRTLDARLPPVIGIPVLSTTGLFLFAAIALLAGLSILRNRKIARTP